jgi:translation elongation factor EF-1alpha
LLNLVKIGTLFINFINCHNNGRFGAFCMFDRLNCLWHNTDALLDAITLTAEILEFSAVTQGPAQGTVLEARLEKGRGKVTTILVQSGTLKKGDIMIAGTKTSSPESGTPDKPSTSTGVEGVASFKIFP